MTLLLGCPVTDDLLGRWVLHMVSPRAPFYLADDDRRLLPAGVVVLTRAELAADYADLPLEARDSYATYHVDHAGAWATLLDDGAREGAPLTVSAPGHGPDEYHLSCRSLIAAGW